jgi:hypothetical protein
MWRWNRKRVDETSLQRMEAKIFRALEVGSEEIEVAASSPFFYRRLRVSIEAEARRRAESGKEWLAWLVTARQATPALALVALLAIGVFWTFTERYSPNPNNELTASELSGVISPSNDELLSALAGWERQEQKNSAETAGSSANSRKE